MDRNAKRTSRDGSFFSLIRFYLCGIGFELLFDHTEGFHELIAAANDILVADVHDLSGNRIDEGKVPGVLGTVVDLRALRVQSFHGGRDDVFHVVRVLHRHGHERAQNGEDGFVMRGGLEEFLVTGGRLTVHAGLEGAGLDLDDGDVEERELTAKADGIRFDRPFGDGIRAVEGLRLHPSALGGAVEDAALLALKQTSLEEGLRDTDHAEDVGVDHLFHDRSGVAFDEGSHGMDAGEVEQRVEAVGIAFDGLGRFVTALLARDVQLDADDAVRAAGLKVGQGLAVVSRENGPLSGSTMAPAMPPAPPVTNAYFIVEFSLLLHRSA